MIFEEVKSSFKLTDKQLNELLFSKYAYHEKIFKSKSGKDRTIRIPNNNLKDIQKYILSNRFNKDFEKERFFRYQFAYLKGKSSLDYAKKHIRREYVFKFDVENFFDQITFARVLGTLKKRSFLPEEALFISQLACYRRRENFQSIHIAIAQGGPLSPILSNLVSSSIDKMFLKFLEHYLDVSYNRYSDDITISTNNRETAYMIESNIEKIEKRMEEINFKLNPNKTKIIHFGKKIVGGLKVNENLNVQERMLTDIRINLYYSSKDYCKARDKYISLYRSNVVFNTDLEKNSFFERSLKGKIQYLVNVKGIEDIVALKYASIFNKNANFKMHFDVRSRIEKSVFPLLFLDEGGVHCNGTAFFVKDLGLFTCFHNFVKISNPKLRYSNFVINMKLRNGNLQKFELKIDMDVLLEEKKKSINEFSKYSVFDEKNDIAFISIKSLQECLTNFDLFRMNIEGLSIVDSTLLNKDLTKIKLCIYGYQEYFLANPSIQSKIVRIQKATENDFELTDYIGRGVSGGPVVTEDYQVFGIYKKGHEDYQKGKCANIFEVYDFLKR